MPVIAAFGPSREGPPATRGGATAARKYPVVAMPSLDWNEDVARETAHLYERIKTVVPAIEWPFSSASTRSV